MTFMTRMDLKSITLSEICRQRKILRDFTYIWKLKHKQVTEPNPDTENHWLPEGKGFVG